MEQNRKAAQPDNTAVRTGLWRDEILDLASKAGFKEAKTISTKDMEKYYFANRTDGLLPASGEVFLLART